MIKNLFFIFYLQLDLAKSSKKWSPFFLYLPMDDNHFGYKQKFVKKTLITTNKSCQEIIMKSLITLIQINLTTCVNENFD